MLLSLAGAASRTQAPLPRVVFVLDHGGPVSEREWGWVRQALLDTEVRHLLDAVKAGVVLSSPRRACDPARLVLPTGRHAASAIASALPKRLGESRRAAPGHALTAASNHLAPFTAGVEGDSPPGAVILLTKGQVTCGPRPEGVVRRLRRNGIPTFVIGLGARHLDHRTLSRLARISGTGRVADAAAAYFHGRNPPELVSSLKTVMARIMR